MGNLTWESRLVRQGGGRVDVVVSIKIKSVQYPLIPTPETFFLNICPREMCMSVHKDVHSLLNCL